MDSPNPKEKKTEKPEQRKEETFVIPVLKTYASDYEKIAGGMSELDLRKMLAKEMEKKRQAEEEYKQKVRKLFVDQSLLQEETKQLSEKDIKRQHEKAMRNEKKKDIHKLVARALGRGKSKPTLHTPQAISGTPASLGNNQEQNPLIVTMGSAEEEAAFRKSEIFQEEEKKEASDGNITVEKVIAKDKRTGLDAPQEEDLVDSVPATEKDPIEIEKIRPPKKPSLLGRLFGRFRKKRAPADAFGEMTQPEQPASFGDLRMGVDNTTEESDSAEKESDVAIETDDLSAIESELITEESKPIVNKNVDKSGLFVGGTMGDFSGGSIEPVKQEDTSDTESLQEEVAQPKKRKWFSFFGPKEKQEEEVPKIAITKADLGGSSIGVMSFDNPPVDSAPPETASEKTTKESTDESDSVESRKPSLLGRLFGGFRKKRTPADAFGEMTQPEKMTEQLAESSTDLGEFMVSTDNATVTEKDHSADEAKDAVIKDIVERVAEENHPTLGDATAVVDGVPADGGLQIDGGEPVVGVDATVVAESDPTIEKARLMDEPQKSGSLWQKLRGLDPFGKTFSTEEKEKMAEKGKRIVEREKLKDAWKDIEARKEKLKDMGAEVRDFRSYTLKKTPNRSINRQNILFTAIIVLLLVALVVILATIALRPEETVVAPPTTGIELRDVITNENQIFVNLSSSIDIWKETVQQKGELATVTKFVPYTLIGTESVILSLQNFARTADMRIPRGLLNALGEYYFIGQYSTSARNQGIFIFSVKDYGDALVWMLNWEKDAINAFWNVFPDTFQRSSRDEVNVVSATVDNKSVRVLNNGKTETSLMYYFFDRNILVVVAGDESLIPEINNRIRSAYK